MTKIHELRLKVRKKRKQETVTPAWTDNLGLGPSSASF